MLELYGGATIYQGGDDLGPLGRWPDRYHAAWTRPLAVAPRIVAKDGDLSLGDRDSELRINRAADDVDPSVSPGGELLLLASNRPPPEGTDLGGYDLYLAERRGSGFGEAQVLPPPLSTLFQERSPSLALLPDGGARLLFTSNRLHGLATDFDLFIAERTPDGIWRSPMLLEGVSTSADERGATIHPEGDALVFSRPGARGIEYFESYEQDDGEWSPPRRLASLAHPDNGATIRFDEGGSALLFARGDTWFRSRLRILHEVPGGGTPWGALILLALALLLMILRALASRWSGLEVLYRCLLISILVHLFLWWWLQDRGLEAPTPTDPGPPAEEVAPIELDPELFARARTPAARERAFGEAIPEVAPVEVVVDRARTERAAALTRESLPQETAETTPELAESVLPESPRRGESAAIDEELTEAAAPARSETALADRSEFELRRDPGRRSAESESTPAEVAARVDVSEAEANGAESPLVPRRVEDPGGTPIAFAEPRPADPDAMSASSASASAAQSAAARPEVARSARAESSLTAPTRESPRDEPSAPIAAAATPNEVAPRERTAPLDPRTGERRASDAVPTPRPTRVRPGPSESVRPAAELSRITGVSDPKALGGFPRTSDRPRTDVPEITPPTTAARMTAARMTGDRTSGTRSAASLADASNADDRARRTEESIEESALADALPSPDGSQGRSANTARTADEPTPLGRTSAFRRPSTRGDVTATEVPPPADPARIGTSDHPEGEAGSRDGADDGAPVVARRTGGTSTPATVSDLAAGSARPATRSGRTSDRTSTGATDRTSDLAAGGGASPDGRPNPNARRANGSDPDVLEESPLAELAPASARTDDRDRTSVRPSPSRNSANRADGRPDPDDRPGLARVDGLPDPEARPSPTRRTSDRSPGPLDPTADALAPVRPPTDRSLADAGRAEDRPTDRSDRNRTDSSSPDSNRTDRNRTDDRTDRRSDLADVRPDADGRADPRRSSVRGESIEELTLSPVPAPGRTSAASLDRPETSVTRRTTGNGPTAPPTARLAPIAGSEERAVVAAIPAPVATADDWVPWVSARRGPRKEEALRRGGGNEETEAAVRAGLAYLAEKQRAHGGWGSARDRHEKYGETTVGRSALALLAFLGAGHAPGTETEYSALTAEAIAYLRGHQVESNGHFGAHTSCYSHAIATYALGEAVLLGAGPEVRRAVERGVEQILRNQELDRRRPDRYGGWSYFYADGHRFDEYPRVSISVWQLMALETAKLAGIEVPDDRIAAGKEWVLSMWSDDLGRYYYNHDPRRLRRGQKTLPASTPAAAFVLQVLGHDPEDHRLGDALAMVAARPPSGWRESSADAFLENGAGNAYFWYYGTLALFLHGGARWDAWNERLQTTLLPSQRRDGSWRPISPYAEYAGDSSSDAIYTTALNVLTLEVYYRYLTPFQKSLTEE